jgi:hypothetical protein
MSLGTKSYFVNETQMIHRSQDLWNDLGYSLDIPWNDVYTAGWQDSKPHHADGQVWGYERKQVMRNDPEYFAPDNIVRSNVIPSINIHNPIYAFDRREHTITI